MMSISTVSAGAAASGYYKEEGYYKAGSDEAKNSAAWFGKDAEAQGLTGQVDDQRFAELLEGQAPDGKLMGRYVDGERQHRPGLDLTFSASKSASIAALVVGDTRVIEAHDKAVRAAMEVVEERFAKTRIQKDGEIVTTKAEGIIAGIYRHDTSRALDPNLHSHAVIANMVKNENGTYTALTNEAIFKHQKLITEVYRSDFEARLKEMGIATERGKYGEVNLTAIPQHVSDQFSTRRKEILEALKARGDEINAKTAEKAALATRAAKHGGLDRDALRAEWRDQASGFGLSRDTLEKGRVDSIAPAPSIPFDQQRAPSPGRMPPESRGLLERARDALTGAVTPGSAEHPTHVQTAVSKAVAHLSEREAAYSRIDLTVTAMRFSPSAQLETVEREIEARLNTGDLFRDPTTDLVTDIASVALERAILRTWRETSKLNTLKLRTTNDLSPKADLNNRLGKTRTLTDGQKDAILTSLTGQGRYVGVQGYAGTGKTFMLERMAHYAAQSGYAIKAYGPSHQSVQELGKVLGRADTLAKQLTAERNHPQQADNRKTILVLDEASMVSGRDMRSFMDYAERTKAARVVLVGDTKQLDAVAAGHPFKQLQEAGMPVAIMDEVRRQENPELRQAVLSAMRGDIDAAFERLKGHVHQVDNIAQAATRAYMSLKPDLRAETRILTLTNAMRKEISAALREELKERGQVGYHDTRLDGLANRQLSQVEASEARNYAPGDTVIPTATSKQYGLTKNTAYRVADVDRASNTLTLTHDKSGETTLPLSASFNRREIGKTLVVYAPEERALAWGDQIRFRITDKETGITNGQRGTVTSTRDGMIKVKTKDGQTHELKPDSIAARGIEHDYAATTHAVQGETVDRVLVAMSSAERLVTQKSFYVEISRARHEAILLTDDPDRLAQTIATETGERVSALETWQEDRLNAERDDSRDKDREHDEKADRQTGRELASREADPRHDDDKARDQNDDPRAKGEDQTNGQDRGKDTVREGQDKGALGSSIIDKDTAEKIREIEQHIERQREKAKEITR